MLRYYSVVNEPIELRLVYFLPLQDNNAHTYTHTHIKITLYSISRSFARLVLFQHYNVTVCDANAILYLSGFHLPIQSKLTVWKILLT